MNITNITVGVHKKLDTGYEPYIQYLKACKAAKVQVPFGTRENSNLEISVFASASVSEGEDVENAISVLTQRVNDAVDKGFREISGVGNEGVPEEAFVVSSTSVAREVVVE